jgi:hypothetical protein
VNRLPGNSRGWQVRLASVTGKCGWQVRLASVTGKCGWQV